MVENRRETGARKFERDQRGRRAGRTDQDAALPLKPEPYGLTEDVDETEAGTRKSGGGDPSGKPSAVRGR